MLSLDSPIVLEIVLGIFFDILWLEKYKSTLMPMLIKIFDNTKVVKFFPTKQIVIIFLILTINIK